jgi:hypothetical protein
MLTATTPRGCVKIPWYTLRSIACQFSSGSSRIATEVAALATVIAIIAAAAQPLVGR